MSTTKMLLCVFVILMITLYVQSYFKTKDDYTIIQSYLDKITIDTLHDKHPIVIYDLIQDPKTLMKSLFAYSYISVNYKMSSPDALYKTRSKFTLLYNDTTDVFVNIISPKYRVNVVQGKPIASQSNDVQYITIKLKQNQVLVLPILWYYACDKQCKTIGLDDVLSSIYKISGAN